mgnify:CR=1 FL=1
MGPVNVTHGATISHGPPVHSSDRAGFRAWNGAFEGAKARVGVKSARRPPPKRCRRGWLWAVPYVSSLQRHLAVTENGSCVFYAFGSGLVCRLEVDGVNASRAR